MPNEAQPSRKSRRSTWVPSDVATPKGGGASRRKKRSGDADQWLPLPKRGSRRAANRIATDVGSNGDRPDAEAAAATPERARPKRARVPKRASPRERWLLIRLRRSQRRVDEQKEEIKELKSRVRELERPSGSRTPPRSNGTESDVPRSPKRARKPASTARPAASDRKRAGSSKGTDRKPRANGRTAAKAGGRTAKPSAGKRAKSRRG